MLWRRLQLGRSPSDGALDKDAKARSESLAFVVVALGMCRLSGSRLHPRKHHLHFDMWQARLTSGGWVPVSASGSPEFVGFSYRRL
mmetsp:Transcript_98411/g.282939  ORF Transcript_98411/g.282939 Transcript_98411/m.282939 type:complete len:86 (+) Transcript_98411:117-374(+)